MTCSFFNPVGRNKIFKEGTHNDQICELLLYSQTHAENLFKIQNQKKIENNSKQELN